MRHLSEKQIMEYSQHWERSERQRRQRARHLSQCAHCRDRLEALNHDMDRLSFQPFTDPDSEELKPLRNQVMAQIIKNVPQSVSPVRRAGLRPVWLLGAAAIVFVLGFVLGRQPLQTSAFSPALQTVSNDFSFINAELNDDKVELTRSAEPESTVKGRLEDTAIQCAIAAGLLNDNRVNHRLKNISLLRPTLDNRPVVDALLVLARHDENPGVRLKAVKILAGLAKDSDVQQCLLDRSINDTVTGVRSLATRVLIDSHDPEALAALKIRAAKDPLVRALLLAQNPESLDNTNPHAFS